MHHETSMMLGLVGVMKRKLAMFIMCISPAVYAGGDIDGVQVAWDNDLWAKGKTDRWYTNGIRLTWTYSSPPESVLSSAYLRASNWLLLDGLQPTLSYTIGQSMYTPRDIKLPQPPLDDRPWGAYLYFGITAHGEKQPNQFRSTELKIGVTGKGAFGEPVQKFVHQVVSSDAPQGWNQQLRPRLGIQISHARVQRLGDTLEHDKFAFQLGWGAATGTLRTHANLGAAVIFGLLKGQNTPLLMGNEGDFVVQDFNGSRKHLRTPFTFLSANITGVAYNYFIEGSTPYGKSKIKPRHSYATLSVGFSIPIGEKFRAVYTQSVRSPEFDGAVAPYTRGQRQRWGTFELNWAL